MRRIGIIGGGAAGIVAAIMAARSNRQAQVFILEQKEKIGRKLLATGNGRCNLTNRQIDDSCTASCYHGEDIRFAGEVLERFGCEDTLRFFESLGLVMKSRGDYVYPRSDQASTVIGLLNQELKRLGVEVFCSVKVLSAVWNGREFCIRAEETLEDKTSKGRNKGQVVKKDRREFNADRLILACGGKAAPALGSDGSGYQLAKSFGHRIAPVVPALVQLKVKDHPFAKASGVRTDAQVTALVDGVPAAMDTGEVQITAYGISGIPVFQISRHIALGLYQKKRVEAVLDLLPEYTEDEVSLLLAKRAKRQPGLTIGGCLEGIFNQKLVPLILGLAGMKTHTRLADADGHGIHKIAVQCKRICLQIQDTNGFENAQVCAGGVRTDEMDPRTMESTRVKGLYIAGELLDVDGICGGYNLQWAWATGCIAGTASAAEDRKSCKGSDRYDIGNRTPIST
jgi:hypothetical protein